MQNTLANHMRVFVTGDVSVQSLIYAAQAERDDRETAKRVLMVVAGWDKGATSMSELRARVQDLVARDATLNAQPRTPITAKRRPRTLGRAAKRDG